MSDTSFGFPVFDSSGNMLGNQTSNIGQIPAIPGNSLTTGGVTTNLNGSTLGTGISGSTISTPAASATPNTAGTTTAPAAITPAAGPSSGSLADYFARAIIIVLGFIFIAVGLNMLRPGTIPTPRIGA